MEQVAEQEQAARGGFGQQRVEPRQRALVCSAQTIAVESECR